MSGNDRLDLEAASRLADELQMAADDVRSGFLPATETLVPALPLIADTVEALVRRVKDLQDADADAEPARQANASEVIRLRGEVVSLGNDLYAARATIARIEAFERLLAVDRGSTTCEDIAGRLRYELGRDPRP